MAPTPHPNAHPRAGRYGSGAQIASALERRAGLLIPQTLEVLRKHAMLLETLVKANASGRPGPKVVTGDYRRSWAHEVALDGTVVEAVVGTNKPQARRLEYGFVGADILGRVFDQPPYPHVGPAVDKVKPLVVRALGDVADGEV